MFFRKKETVKEIHPTFIPTTFAQDFHFLEEVIDKKFENEKLTLNLKGIKNFSDNDCIELVINIAQNVINTLSSDYRKLLACYIEESEIDEYITTMITVRVISYAISVNANTFTR